MHRADLKGADIGDLTDRHAIKDRLGCKSFRWFLENVYPHKFVMDEQSIAWGRMRAANGGNKVCIDHLQRDMVNIETLRIIFSLPNQIFFEGPDLTAYELGKQQFSALRRFSN